MPVNYSCITQYLHNPDRWGWCRESWGRLDGEDAAEGRLNYACNTLAIVSVRMLCVPRIEHLGLTLAEAKQTLTALQQRLVERQTAAFVAAHSQCEHCGQSLGIKGYHTRTFRTLFGTVTLTSPRLYHCRCQRRKTTFRPLNALLTDSVA